MDSPTPPTPPQAPGQVVTFYSYKGGTGRTMALANVACLLAEDVGIRHQVLVVDWDLEAPGLHRYFPPRLRPRTPSLDLGLDAGPGLIDLLIDLQAALPTDPPGSPDEADRHAAAALDSVNFDHYIGDTEVANVRILRAGRNDDNQYAKRVISFNWERLFARAPSLYRMLAERMALRFRWVLVDSRTGVTDISGICTALLPEKLVVVFTPNQQSLTGVRELVSSATAYRLKSDDLRPLLIYPLPSRIEASLQDLRKRWRFGDIDAGVSGYQPMFQELMAQAYGLKNCDLNEYFDAVQIQQTPDFAYGEEIAVRRSGDRFSIANSYRVFVDRLQSGTPPWPASAALPHEASDASPNTWPKAPPEPALAPISSIRASAVQAAGAPRRVGAAIGAAVGAAVDAEMPAAQAHDAGRRLGAGMGRTAPTMPAEAPSTPGAPSQAPPQHPLPTAAAAAGQRSSPVSPAGDAPGMLFFSYASEDRNRIRPVADALQQAGFNVWWDRAIPAGVRFDQAIAEALDASAAVLVFWSEASVRSSWVLTEAEEGLRRGVLFPVLLDDVSPPLGFRTVQAADMRRDANRGIEQLVLALQHQNAFGGGAPSTMPSTIPAAVPVSMSARPPPRAPDAAAAQRAGRWSGVAAALLALGVGAYWFVAQPSRPDGAVAPATTVSGASAPAMPASVQLASFVGASATTASLEIERLGLRAVFLDFDTRAITDASQGVVSQQTPASGPVAAGSAVEFVIDKRALSVPSLIGIDLAAALKTLDAVGLKLGPPLTITVAGARVGSIVAQEPQAGAAVARGAVVVVTVVGAFRKTSPERQFNSQAEKR